MRTLLTLGLVAIFATATRAEDKKELDALQGKWTIVSIERDGKADEKWAGGTRTVEGTKYTLAPKSGDAVTGTFTVDATKKPKTTDLKPDSGTFKGKTLPGIYVLEGDTLKVCFDGTGKERPTDFVSKPGSGHVLTVYKRVK